MSETVTERIPDPVIYAPSDPHDLDTEHDEWVEQWGPYVLLRLPVGVVRAIRETLRNTPVNQMHGLDGATIDEINHQLRQQVTQVPIDPARGPDRYSTPSGYSR